MNLAYLLITVLSFFSPNGKLQSTVSWTKNTSLPAAEVIYFEPGENLEWDHFQGIPPNGGRAAAVTVSGFGYQANVSTRSGAGNIDIKVYCYFNKNKSWVKPGRTTAYILEHEQHHFDISYIAACLFVEKLKKADFTTANYDALLGKIYNESTAIMNSMQDAYDGETKNGQLRDVQAEWNDHVDNQVNEVIK